MCAFCRALRRYAMKLNRLRPVGKSTELAERVFASSWAALVDLSLDLEKLGCHLSDKSLKMLGLRRRGFDWKEIADALHMSETAARTAFWREIRRATSKKLDRDYPGRTCHEPDEISEVEQSNTEEPVVGR